MLCHIHSDYEEVTTFMTFSSLSSVQSINITIHMDGILEDNEQFRVILELINGEENRIFLQPDSSVITIVDNDGG